MAWFWRHCLPAGRLTKEKEMTHPIFLDTSLYDSQRADPLHPKEFIYDRPVNWMQQAAAGAGLAFIKSSEIVTDPAFLMQWGLARKAGLILGAWEFFHPGQNAITQAQKYIKLMNQAGVVWNGNKLTSDKLILDFEVTDNEAGSDCLKAAASWVFEVRKAFPHNEICIYTGTPFWMQIGGTDEGGKWAKDLSLWFAAWPLDPNPEQNVQPLPFGWAEVRQIAADVLSGKFAAEPLPPWTAPTYRQFTAWAKSSEVPGHPAIKKVVDVDVSMIEFPETGGAIPEVHSPQEIPDTGTQPGAGRQPGTPVQPRPGMKEPVFTKVEVVQNHSPRIRSGPGQAFPDIGVVMPGTVLFIDDGPTNSYVHFANVGATPNPLLPPGGWVFAAFTKPITQAP
jgi:hypothetical protein